MKNKKHILILIVPILIVVIGLLTLFFLKPDKNDQTSFCGSF